LDRTVEEARAAIAAARRRVAGIADDLALTPRRPDNVYQWVVLGSAANLA